MHSAHLIGGKKLRSSLDSRERRRCVRLLCVVVHMCVFLCIHPITQDPEGDFANLAMLISYGGYGLDGCKIHDAGYLAVNS